MPAVEYSKEFITSVVVGKDVVPRIGLHQLEQLRSDLMDVIKHSKQSKVRHSLKSLILGFILPDRVLDG